MADEQPRTSTTTATKISTAIIVITAAVVFGVGLFLIFRSPITSHNDDTDNTSITQDENTSVNQ